jgi:uncharacterized protein YbjT (DUF2867 family)
MTILVMNSTGKVGQEIVRELHRAKADFRAATRSLERANSLWDFPAPATYFSYDDPATFAPVLEGVIHLFMLHPEDQPARHQQLFAFIDAAIEAGVKEIVFMSALGADLRPDDPLCQVEQHVAQSGARYTILRPNWFMQNFNAQDSRRINVKNEVLMPSGDARLALIDTRDIAAVAAKLLLDGMEHGKTYTLTGGETFSYGDVAARLSAIVNRTITHNSPSPASEIERMKSMNAAPEQVYFMEWLFDDIVRGYAATITTDVQDILGRPPRTFEQYVRDYAHVWQISTPS